MKTFVEPVIGYRAWHVNAGTYGLSSPICKQEWIEDGPTEASCMPIIAMDGTNRRVSTQRHLEEKHASPDPRCICGLYGWHRPQDTEGYFDSGRHAIVGACLAWGKYKVATKGFRIQYMEPLCLVDPDPDRPILGWRALRDKAVERYQIPLLPRDMLQEYAETFGSPMGIEFME